jgi:alpha-D-xyloside xylohydrolase
MRPYIRTLMKAAHEKGDPVMRPLFYDFPDDPKCWENEKQFMFGPDCLVTPVMTKAQKTAEVYLPEGAEWTDVWTGKKYSGGMTVTVETPIDQIPLFGRNGFSITD